MRDAAVTALRAELEWGSFLLHTMPIRNSLSGMANETQLRSWVCPAYDEHHDTGDIDWTGQLAAHRFAEARRWIAAGKSIDAESPSTRSCTRSYARSSRRF